LGVFDDELWSAIDFAWKLLLMSLAVCTGKPEVLESIRNAEKALAEGEQELEESLSADGQEHASSFGSNLPS
jgi:hypothetical protein